MSSEPLISERKSSIANSLEVEEGLVHRETQYPGRETLALTLLLGMNEPPIAQAEHSVTDTNELVPWGAAERTVDWESENWILDWPPLVSSMTLGRSFNICGL